MIINVSAVRLWQWLGLGLIVGAILGGVRVYWQGQAADPAAKVLTQAEFERELAAVKRTISGITVFPVHDGVHFVSAARDKDGSIVYAAPEPYRPLLPAEMKGQMMTFRQYLRGAGVGYSYVWSEDWRVVMGIWSAVGLISIGVVWPVILAVLIRLGYAPPRPVREPKVNLSRYKPEKNEEAAAKKGMSAVDMEKLRAVEAELARNLAGGHVAATGAGRPGQSGETSSPAAEDRETPIALSANQRFSNTPAEHPAMVEAPKEEKSYRGTFYPTEVHTTKKPE